MPYFIWVPNLTCSNIQLGKKMNFIIIYIHTCIAKFTDDRILFSNVVTCTASPPIEVKQNQTNRLDW